MFRRYIKSRENEREPINTLLLYQAARFNTAGLRAHLWTFIELWKCLKHPTVTSWVVTRPQSHVDLCPFVVRPWSVSWSGPIDAHESKFD